MQKLNKKQQKVYDFVLAYIGEYGYPPSVRDICDALNFSSPSTAHYHLKRLADLGYIKRGLGKGRAIAPNVPAEGARGIPLLGTVAAGAPIWADERVEEYLPYTGMDAPENCFALRVRGLSMKNAGILPDDLVIVRRQTIVENGEIVVALLGDEATVKRFWKEDGHIRLLPENEDFSPIDGDDAQILGRVIAVIRRY